MGLRYFSDWKTKTFDCPQCRSSYTGEAASVNLFEALFELLCPDCGQRLETVGLPTVAEIRDAANGGNPEAAEMLEDLDSSDTGYDQQMEKAVRSWNKVPDFPGDALTFSLETEWKTDSLNPEWLILMHNGREVYREPSGFEHWEAVIEIGGKLLRKCPGRIAWFDPGQAGVQLLGDSFRAEERIGNFLDDNGLRPPSGLWSK